MKFITYIILTVILFSAAFVRAESHLAGVHCEPELKHYWHTLLQVPEVKHLAEKVKSEGSLSIRANRHTLAQQFGAFWDLDKRIICVDVSASRSAGDIISSILFELHNAAATARLDRLDDLAREGQLDKENYVRAVEHVEYQNSLSASRIAAEGIRQGLFPASAHLPTYRNFDEHYHYQKIGGHSAWIARNYDNIQQLRAAERDCAPGYKNSWK